jgi:quercetin dioxygenase-like cupin family protein
MEIFMRQISRAAAAALALLAAPLLLAATNITAGHHLTVETARVETLLRADSSWNGKPYTHYARGRPQLTLLKVTLKPNSALPWHTHPMPNAGYILSGDLTLHDRASGVTHTYHAGESFAESVNTEHRGEAGPNGAVLLITYAGVPGMPTSIPAQGEKPEY